MDLPEQGGGDDTIRVSRQRPPAAPPARRGPRWGAPAAVAACVIILIGVGTWVWWPRPPPPHPGVVVPAQPPAIPAPPKAIPVPPPKVTVVPAPVPAPPEFTIQTASEEAIRDHAGSSLAVFRFADDPRILVLDFPTLHEQAMMLNRVAALVEKAGLPRDRDLTDAELEQAIRAGGDTPDTYYYGHDYSAAALVRFFALADRQHLRLNPEEERLRRLMQQLGWFKPGVDAGLISIPAAGASASVTMSARSTILHHELSHGFFFSDPPYRAFVHRFWDTALTAAERDEVRRFLGSEGYDTQDEELMYNEMQAYLMFTDDPRFFRPDLVGMTAQRREELRAEFLRGMPKGWLHDWLAAKLAVVPVAQPVH